MQIRHHFFYLLVCLSRSLPFDELMIKEYTRAFAIQNALNWLSIFFSLLHLLHLLCGRGCVCVCMGFYPHFREFHFVTREHIQYLKLESNDSLYAQWLDFTHHLNKRLFPPEEHIKFAHKKVQCIRMLTIAAEAESKASASIIAVANRTHHVAHCKI